MIWLIGFILFMVELYVLLHTTYCEWESTSRYQYRTYNYDNPLELKVYQVLLLLLGNLWWCCILTAVIFFIVWLVKWSNPSDESGKRGTIWSLKIDNFLTKFLQMEIPIKKKEQ